MKVPLDHIKKSGSNESLVIDASADAVPLDQDKKMPAESTGEFARACTRLRFVTQITEMR